jgi:uncharacterized protein (TIGR03435 family)
MKKAFIFFAVLSFLQSGAQDPILKVGSPFPDIVLRNISNAPVKELYLNKTTDKKFYILNFWGTWCSPCIPEMDTLAKLQKKNAGKIQVLAISDDPEERKAKYLSKKPSSIWLATDTSHTLYKMFGLAYVGQSAIIGADKRIVALVRTDSINQQLIDKLFRGDSIKISADTRESAIKSGEDFFGVDSLLEHSFTIRGYSKGQPAMSKRYLSEESYRGRRISFFNVSLSSLYRSAYGIRSFRKQEFYDPSVTEQEVHTHDNRNTAALYSVDLLVKPSQKDSLDLLLQQYLNLYLPVKARLEKRKIEVYVLKQLPGTTITFLPSTAENSSSSFSGRGYNGIKVTLSEFAGDYLANELGFPVIDETGIKGHYDITTTVEFRTAENIRKSIATLGLGVEKAEREVDVIVYYK